MNIWELILASSSLTESPSHTLWDHLNNLELDAIIIHIDLPQRIRVNTISRQDVLVRKLQHNLVSNKTAVELNAVQVINNESTKVQVNEIQHKC